MKKIDIILLEDVTNLGRAGDIVAVAEGYARNNLFPAGRAALADAAAKHAAAGRQETQEKKKETERVALQAKAAELDGTELTVTARVKDGLDIFGRITAPHIAKQLSEQTGLKIKTKDISLPEAVTRLGEYDITVSVGPDSEAVIKLVVTALPDTAADA